VKLLNEIENAHGFLVRSSSCRIPFPLAISPPKWHITSFWYNIPHHVFQSAATDAKYCTYAFPELADLS